jgi:hypothetical protein
MIGQAAAAGGIRPDNSCRPGPFRGPDPRRRWMLKERLRGLDLDATHAVAGYSQACRASHTIGIRRRGLPAAEIEHWRPRTIYVTSV